MKIIIDGCDLTGKTTLINQILAYYNDPSLSYLHFSYRDRRDYDFYNTILDKENFIADRHFLDEMIYPKVFNREPGLTRFKYEDLLMKCLNNDIKIIILTCSDEELLKRSKTRTEEPEVIDNLLAINKQFKDLAYIYNLQIFDTTKNKLTDVIEYIERS
ncbi:MAG: hypothetical protein PHC75_10810 [Burkholderiales bacterium]|nr:hypothetical protein [Burkholderiales bacterium]